ncbi:MAG TPA: hypothetical protein VFG89_06045 [Coriobacteriia bacterium]|nr:hypothetical protein [Coriobacteriia bacterium]
MSAPNAATPSSTEAMPSRRTAILAGVAALVGMGATVLAPPKAYAALDGFFVLGRSNSADGGSSSLTSSTSYYTLVLTNTDSTSGSVLNCTQNGGSSYGAFFNHTGSGQTVFAQNLGTGVAVRALVDGTDSSANAIDSLSKGVGAAVSGTSSSASHLATGVRGELTNANAAGAAVYGRVNTGTANAVLGSVDSNCTGAAVYGVNEGLGRGVSAGIANVANSADALSARTTGTGYAIHAEGGKAQLHLKPMATAGPPTTNAHQLGEIYVDAAGRIYSCTAAGTPGTWIALGASTAIPGDLLHFGANTGTVAFQAPAAGATALAVTGAVTFDRSGKAKVAKGKASAKVTVPGGIAKTASVLCTAQNSGGSGVVIKYAKRVSATQFQIVLNKKTTSAMTVAWMVIG